MIAQDRQVPTQNHRHYRHYKLIDIGTFGGPNGSFVLPPPGEASSTIVARRREEQILPPLISSRFNFDCSLSYGFKWQDDVPNKLSAQICWTPFSRPSSVIAPSENNRPSSTH